MAAEPSLELFFASEIVEYTHIGLKTNSLLYTLLILFFFKPLMFSLSIVNELAFPAALAEATDSVYE